MRNNPFGSDQPVDGLGHGSGEMVEKLAYSISETVIRSGIGRDGLYKAIREKRLREEGRRGDGR